MEDQKTSKTISFMKLREFMRNPDVSPLEKCVIVDLLLYAGSAGEAYPSLDTVGRDLSRSERQIRRSIEALRSKGLLDWKKRGYSKSNQYILNSDMYVRHDTSIRTPMSSQSGHVSPFQSGHESPPNVSQESNQRSSSTRLFEETFKKTLSGTEIIRLNKLCKEHTEEFVLQAIKEAAGRKLKYVNIGLIENILGDWKIDGKPTPRPVFVPCGKGICEEGFIFSEGVASLCPCKRTHQQELENWKNKRTKT